MYNMEITFKLELILLILILIAVIYGFTFYSCCRCGNSKSKNKSKEGYSDLSDYNIQRRPINTSSWFTPNLTYSSGGQISQGIQDILNRPTQPIPLPEGELLMFVNTPFKPECCSTSYSNSMGCACMTVTNNGKQGQYEYLRTRGGNNVPYSEF